MKIAVDALTAKSFYHGMGIYIFNLLKRMIQVAEDHKFIVYKKPDVFSDFTITNDKVQINNIKGSRSLRILWEYTLLPASLKHEKVDVFWGPSNFLPPAKSCKFIVTIHDLSAFTYAQTYPFIRRRYYQYIISKATQRADFIITDSESSKQDLIKYFSIPDDKVIVIYCGIDEIFQPVESQDVILNVKQKYKLPAEFIFTLGVLEPKKNTERLIKAYARLKDTFKDIPHLVVGGSKKYGWKNEKIFQLVNSLKLNDLVLFTGAIDHKDLPVVYSAAELFVLPSLYEGFGLPVIEAMACGTPVVTSNTSSLPEIAGNAAVLVNPYNVLEIADVISLILYDENKKQEMIKNGFENIKRFNWEKAATELISVFEKVYN